jgi:hypothetical protein
MYISYNNKPPQPLTTQTPGLPPIKTPDLNRHQHIPCTASTAMDIQPLTPKPLFQISYSQPRRRQHHRKMFLRNTFTEIDTPTFPTMPPLETHALLNTSENPWRHIQPSQADNPTSWDQPLIRIPVPDEPTFAQQRLEDQPTPSDAARIMIHEQSRIPTPLTLTIPAEILQRLQLTQEANEPAIFDHWLQSSFNTGDDTPTVHATRIRYRKSLQNTYRALADSQPTAIRISSDPTARTHPIQDHWQTDKQLVECLSRDVLSTFIDAPGYFLMMTAPFYKPALNHENTTASEHMRLCKIPDMPEYPRVSAIKLRQGQLTDNKLSIMRQHLTMNPLERERIQSSFNRLPENYRMFLHIHEKDMGVTIEGIMCINNRLNDSARPSHIIVTPARYRDHIVEVAHITHHHQGYEAMVTSIRTKYDWPELEYDVREYISSCSGCQEILVTSLQPETINPPIIVTKANQLLQLQVWGFAAAYTGHDMALICTDYFTKYRVAIPMQGLHVTTIMVKLHEFWTRKFGPPEIIQTQINNIIEHPTFHSYAASQGITVIYSTQSYPTTGHTPQDQNQSFSRQVRNQFTTYNCDWIRMLDTAINSHNDELQPGNHATPLMSFHRRGPARQTMWTIFPDCPTISPFPRRPTTTTQMLQHKPNSL